MHPSLSVYKMDVDEHGCMIRHVKSQGVERLRAEFFNFWSFPPLSEQTFKSLLSEKSRTYF